MAHKFFISHYGRDKSIAELFSNALRRITLGQISPWFSSDDYKDSGLKPGDIWFNQILEKITQSKAVVSLLTPNSINRPWIYFESGIGQALKDCEVIPVCIGVKRDNILPPLGLYQCYQLNDYRSVVEFFSKLLTLFGVEFDEEMSKVVIEKLVSDISKITFIVENYEEEGKETIEKIIENLKNHIDKRFLEMIEKPVYQIVGDNINLKIKENEFHQIKKPLEVSYSVSFDIDFPKLKNKNLYIEIRQDDTFKDLTDTLYYMLKGNVPAYTYLEKWIIIEYETNTHIVIREIANMIPAKVIFRPNTKWKIVKLDKPYNALDSSKRLIANRKAIEDNINNCEKAIEDNFDNSEAFYNAAISLLKMKRAFLAPRTNINKIVEYLNAAIMIEPRGIYYYFLAYIKYDYFERKCLNITPNWNETLQFAIQSGVSSADIAQLAERLQIEIPECLVV